MKHQTGMRLDERTTDQVELEEATQREWEVLFVLDDEDDCRPAIYTRVEEAPEVQVGQHKMLETAWT